MKENNQNTMIIIQVNIGAYVIPQLAKINAKKTALHLIIVPLCVHTHGNLYKSIADLTITNTIKVRPV